MYDQEQLVETNWNNFTKKRYMDLGYKFTKIGDVLYVKAKDLPPTSSAMIHANCDYCGRDIDVSRLKYYENSNNGTSKFSCGDSDCTKQKCDELYGIQRRKDQYQKYLNECKNAGYKPLSVIDEYLHSHSMMRYECPIHGNKEIDYADFVYENQRCNDCRIMELADKSRLSIEQVINFIESKNNNKVLNPEDYINAYTKNLNIVCGSCGNIFLSSLANIKNGDGACIDCSHIKTANGLRLSNEQVRNIIESVNDNIWLNFGQYKSLATRNLEVQCKCGNQFTVSLGNYIYNHKNRCDICTKRTSSGELLVMNILDELNIEYLTEYTFSDCKDKKLLPFDFYLPFYNTCIEFDGKLHYEPKYGEETLQNRKRHDKMKTDYCNNNNIKLIRIPYFKSNKAKEIIMTELCIQNKKYA